jgi:hypothetical protein
MHPKGKPRKSPSVDLRPPPGGLNGLAVGGGDSHWQQGERLQQTTLASTRIPVFKNSE